jgi:hypothetical protein
MGAAAIEIHASNARAVAGLAFSVVLRLMREGLVVRALLWPGLLTTLSIFVSAAYTVTWRGGNYLYTDQPELVAPLEEDGFEVTVLDNPEALLFDRRADRAVWREGDKLVLGVRWAEYLKSRAEVRLRDVTGERWRLELPPSSPKPRHRDDLIPITGVIAGIVGLLFTLYGVVIGTGALYRDRSSGVLESDLALPIPRWVHPVARILALAAVLGPAMIVSLVVVDSLLSMNQMGSWMIDGFFAAVAGGALGIGLMARADARRGFSAPLSQGLMGSMALISLGYWAADVGRYLPLLSLGSAFANQHSSWTVAPLTLLLAAAVAADFHRRECL